ncbi:TIGR04282 family arsenosugar biosynthesis glycosyltransferase [Arthrobacter sp. CG_A4]|uniref:TIGR04282 family arsenosugar biosynthesis glycosyltransferase n=1 Tax=Arthrobacter sp. CG_A4 TaxID=3071706 RepID=UPI002E1067E3
MSNNIDLTVAVIAKQCLPGKVKTRLSPPLTPEGAAALAQLSLSRTLATVRLLPVSRRLLVMDGTPATQDAADFTVVQQASGGLDERLAAICDAATGPLLIIGMDTPQFSADHLAPLLHDWPTNAAVHDAWLGPATDGGFWALALRRPDGALIRGVPMSTHTTGAQQLARLSAAGLRVGMLPELRDMDHFSDALTIAGEIPGTEFARAVNEAAVVGLGSRPAAGVTR